MKRIWSFAYVQRAVAPAIVEAVATATREERAMRKDDLWDFEFFAELPRNAAERQAALDAATDPEWSGEALRLRQKIRQRISLRGRSNPD